MRKHSFVAVFMQASQINNPKREAFLNKDASHNTESPMNWMISAYHNASFGCG